MFAPSSCLWYRGWPRLSHLRVAALLVALSAPFDAPTAFAETTIDGSPQLRRTAGRLIVLGIDGLPPALLTEGVASGSLPHFEELYRNGSRAVVDVEATGLPPLSPRIWTSFATGQLPTVHGLHGFVFRSSGGREVLYNSTNRKVPAIWNIATAVGRRVGVVNWWATAPVDTVDGFIVSDLFNDVARARLAKKLGARLDRDADRVVYPPSLAKPLRYVPAVNRMIGMSPQRGEAVDGQIMELAEIAIALHPVDILLVYTRAFDEIAHVAWHTHERRPGETSAGDLVFEYLRRVDWLLGRFLDHVGPNDHLLILSDHGFERYQDPEKRGGTHESTRTTGAVLLLRGPRVRAGANLARLDVLDVLPTMLELAGIPAAEDMPGKIATEAFLADQRDFLPRVESYRLVATGAVQEEESIGDDTVKERLRALGYIDQE